MLVLEVYVNLSIGCEDKFGDEKEVPVVSSWTFAF